MHFKKFTFFSSFEDENEFTAIQQATLSYDERMEQIEFLRKQIFFDYLDTDLRWPSLSKSFSIMKPYINENS